MQHASLQRQVWTAAGGLRKLYHSFTDRRRDRTRIQSARARAPCLLLLGVVVVVLGRGGWGVGLVILDGVGLVVLVGSADELAIIILLLLFLVLAVLDASGCAGLGLGSALWSHIRICLSPSRTRIRRPPSTFPPPYFPHNSRPPQLAIHPHPTHSTHALTEV